MELAAGSERPADLVSRILAGEQAAEEELVSRYRRGIAIIVRRAANDPSVTDDLCQETFRIALEKIRRGDVREAEKLSGFICSLARNLVIEHFRQTSRTAAREVEDAGQIPDQSSDQLSIMLQKEKAAA